MLQGTLRAQRGLPHYMELTTHPPGAWKPATLAPELPGRGLTV